MTCVEAKPNGNSRQAQKSTAEGREALCRRRRYTLEQSKFLSEAVCKGLVARKEE